MKKRGLSTAIIASFVCCFAWIVTANAASTNEPSITTNDPSTITLPLGKNYDIKYTVTNSEHKSPIKITKVLLENQPPSNVKASIKSDCNGVLKFNEACTFHVLLQASPKKHIRRTHTYVVKSQRSTTAPVATKNLLSTIKIIPEVKFCLSVDDCRHSYSATPVLDSKTDILKSAGALQSISIAPSPLTPSASKKTTAVLLGDQMKLVATGQFNGGNPHPVNTLLAWSATPKSIVSITNDGLVTALAPGIVKITAKATTANAEGKIVQSKPFTLESKAVVGSFYKADNGYVFCLGKNCPHLKSGQKGELIQAADSYATSVALKEATASCQSPWRLPTMAELGLIKANQALLIAAGANLNIGRLHSYWSADAYSAKKNKVLSMSKNNFNSSTGVNVAAIGLDNSAYVRCVKTF